MLKIILYFFRNATREVAISIGLPNPNQQTILPVSGYNSNRCVVVNEDNVMVHLKIRRPHFIIEQNPDNNEAVITKLKMSHEVNVKLSSEDSIAMIEKYAMMKPEDRPNIGLFIADPNWGINNEEDFMGGIDRKQDRWTRYNMANRFINFTFCFLKSDSY